MEGTVMSQLPLPRLVFCICSMLSSLPRELPPGSHAVKKLAESGHLFAAAMGARPLLVACTS